MIMRSTRNTLVGLLLLLSLAGCRKEVETLSGSITGRVTLMMADYYPDNFQSGTKVTLLKDGEVLAMDTTANGLFHFDNIPYGIYSLQAGKEGCIPAGSLVKHIGGYSPTEQSLNLFEVPAFTVTLDSASSDKHNMLRFMGKIQGSTETPYFGYRYLVCFGVSPETDISHASSITSGVTFSDDVKGEQITCWVMNDYAYADLSQDTIYARVYPVAWNQSEYDFQIQYLGKPSNLLAFLLNP